MSLHVWFRDRVPEGLKYHRDVEALFSITKFAGTDTDKAFVRDIDRGTYMSDMLFKDRFGVSLYTTCLSTGCKGAICVTNNPELCIDSIEMGSNAFYYLVKHCKDGNVVIAPHGKAVIVVDDYDVQIDVLCEGKRYTSMYALADYVTNSL